DACGGVAYHHDRQRPDEEYARDKTREGFARKSRKFGEGEIAALDALRARQPENHRDRKDEYTIVYDEAAEKHQQIKCQPARSRMQSVLPGGINHDRRGDDGVDQAVEVEFPRRGHEEDVAGLGEDEIEVAAADVAAHLENA